MGLNPFHGRRIDRMVLLLAAQTLIAACAVAAPPEGSSWAEIRVIDEVTGRGVPLVELETVNHLRFVTDNAGRIAFLEPGLMDREIYFSVKSHGYEREKDGFGFAGARITPRAGTVSEIRVRRTMPAERMCRLTGEGRSRDSILLGYDVPQRDAENSGRVAGQDSVQAAIYRNRVYWIWGDTSRMEYPLGLFRVAGATTSIPNQPDIANWSERGIPYNYFVDPDTGFTRAMMPLPERVQGVIWIFGLMVMRDESGVERLFGHYSRRKGLADELEHGIARFDDDTERFVVAKEFPLEDKWRRPTGNPILWEADGRTWWLFGSPTPNVRVPATIDAVLDPQQYEAFTCADPDTDNVLAIPRLNESGQPEWRWQTELPPTESAMELKWIKAGLYKASEARFAPMSNGKGREPMNLHNGSVRWNEYRQRWIMLAGQLGGDASFLGEVWYVEADAPTGPFQRAVKVATHDKQTFYNVVHHPFLDSEGGRVIYFEGTYTNEFSGNPHRTPRYNYNQILYRLDLDDPKLAAARESG
ncbi:MAG: hypothetical protein KF777_15455 [Planctomycetaceae bacterium]|nr:hypothetical protein [Planctomycetaceae bacterium]